MSTDRKRLTSAIQRIAREDPAIRKLLGESDNKGGKPSSSGVGSSDAESDRQCCDGSVSDNANPGTATRDPDSEDAGQEGGLDDADPANLDSMGEGSLTGITDCATGDPVCFDGSDWLPPDGWDGPLDPPPDDTWVDGFYWSGESNTQPEAFFPTCGEARAYATQDIPCGGSSADPGCDGTTGSFSAGGDICGDGISRSYSYGSLSCPHPDPEIDEDVCLDESPLLDSWPEDGCTNLAIKNGAIVGSKYDPENDGSYSKPRSEIQLCDANGNQISMRPAGTGVLPTGEQTSVPERITGGWKTFNSTTNNGYLYDSSGTQIAHIDGNEYSDPNI